MVKNWTVLIIALGLSLGWIIYAALHSTADGGRGGALAVCLSLCTLFWNAPYGVKVQRELQEAQVSAKNGAESLEIAVDGILSRMNIEADGLGKQNRFLFWSSGLGTLAWGFGDWAAQWLQGMGIIHWF